MTMKKIAVLVCMASVFASPGTAEGQEEFNARLLLEEQEASGKDQSGVASLLHELKILIAELDSLMSISDEYPSSRWERNIFKPLVMPVTGPAGGIDDLPRVEEESVVPLLTGTVIGNGRAIAVFGDQEIKVGESINGYRIIKIETGRVTARFGEKTVTILIRHGE